MELGIGDSILMKAIGEAYGRSLAQIKLDLQKEGDLGQVALVGSISAARRLPAEGRA